MVDQNYEPFDIRATFAHLSIDATTTAIADFEWSPEYLAAYQQRFAADGSAGRLVAMMEMTDSWDQWERHPAGEELVISCNVTLDLHQEIDGVIRVVRVDPAGAIVNPANVWHTADIIKPGYAVFITPGQRTEHRAR